MAGMVNYNNQNVYIASLPRSGSTLLGMILNQHPNCFNIGESFYWAKLNPKNIICTCGLKGCPVLSSVYKKIKDSPDILGITETVTIIDSILQNSDTFSREQITKIYSDDIASSCNGFNDLADILRKIIDRNIIIDTSSNIIIAQGLAKFRNWKIIILTRDPRGIIYSLKKAAVRHRENIPENLWRGYIVDFLKRADFLCDKDNVILVRYEDLCADPGAVVNKICNFLGIDFHVKLLKYRRDKGHVLMANRMRFGKNDDIIQDNSWKTHLSREENKIICNDAELINAYKKFNYEIR